MPVRSSSVRPVKQCGQTTFVRLRCGASQLSAYATLAPMLILMVGLPGTGKSTLSRALVERYGGLVIECVASGTTALTRIRRDVESGIHLAANRTVELYLNKKQDFEREPLTGARVTISSDQDLEKSITQARDYLIDIERPIS